MIRGRAEKGECYFSITKMATNAHGTEIQNRKKMKIDEILKKVGLTSLIQRFESENIDSETVNLIIDNELTRLGVTAMGDRVRLREMCKKNQISQQQQPLTTPAHVSYPSVLRERSQLFNRGRQLPSQKKEQNHHTLGHGLFILFV